MAARTPKVEGKQLYLAGDPVCVCQLDTPDWFAWLETMTSFRYYTAQHITVAHGYYASDAAHLCP